MTIRTIIITFGFGLAAMIATSCSTIEPEPPAESSTVPHEGTDASRLEDAQERWNSFGVSDYEFTMQWQCFCVLERVAEVELKVENGKITSGEFAPKSGLTSSVDISQYETVDGLFELLADAIEGGAYNIQVSYHPEKGYPESALIDYSEMIADEEQGFRVIRVMLASQ